MTTAFKTALASPSLLYPKNPLSSDISWFAANALPFYHPCAHLYSESDGGRKTWWGFPPKQLTFVKPLVAKLSHNFNYNYSVCSTIIQYIYVSVTMSDMHTCCRRRQHMQQEHLQVPFGCALFWTQSERSSSSIEAEKGKMQNKYAVFPPLYIPLFITIKRQPWQSASNFYTALLHWDGGRGIMVESMTSFGAVLLKLQQLQLKSI